MFRKVLYQTVEDRGNPKEILNNGPFQCTRSPWLGNGYYFWDSFIELAHWWGRQGYHGQYVITKIDLDTAPLIVNDRTLVPLRAVSESLDMNVDWDGETYTVYLTSKE